MQLLIHSVVRQIVDHFQIVSNFVKFYFEYDRRGFVFKNRADEPDKGRFSHSNKKPKQEMIKIRLLDTLENIRKAF